MKFTQPIALAGLRRTPIGKVGGVLAPIEPYVLLSSVFCETLRVTEARGDILPDDVIVGNVRNSTGNIARVAALDAGLPDSVPAQTVDRQCASSMEALCLAAAKIQSRMARTVLVGGVESASQAPWLFAKTSRPYAYFEPKPHLIRMATEETGDPPMGETAEILADEWDIAREAMDAFAARSHARAAEASREGKFSDECVPLPNPDKRATEKEILLDECIRADTDEEVLAGLRPAFRKDGRVTAGNSSPLNDGAASALALAVEEGGRLGLAVDALVTGAVVVGLDPTRMGLGPALAIPRLLESCGLKMNDVDLFEINEAFAAQVLACLRKLEKDGFALPEEKLNVHGGALALGHPLGATGLRIVVTLAHALRARGLRRGVASLCVGGGQGMAVLVEIPA